MPATPEFERFKPRVLQKDGSPLHYWTGGRADKDALVLLHGTGTDHRTFLPQLPVLVDDFRLLAWDARGHGLSRPIGAAFSFPLLTRDLLTIMDREHIAHAILVGHAMGGNLAQDAARAAPERVDALVLIDSTRNTGQLAWGEEMAARLAPRVLAWYPWGALVSAASHASSVNKEVRAYMTECYRALGHQDFTRIFLETARRPRPDPAYRFGKPMLILAGDQDPTGNVRKVAERWAKEEPDATYVLIPNAGHAAHQDNPTATNEALETFFATLRGESGDNED